MTLPFKDNESKLDYVIDDTGEEFWKELLSAVIARDVTRVFDTAISLKALEEARAKLKKQLKAEE